MSDAQPDRDKLEREARAAEYVLGTATARDAAATERAMLSDPALAEAVTSWERQLAPLAVLAPPEAPPPGLWNRIEAQIGVAAPVHATRPDRWRVRLLRYWAGGATAAALALGVALLFTLLSDGRHTPAPLMAVMVTDRTQAAWSALVERDGAIRLAAMPPVGGNTEPPTPANRTMQLWALPPGASAPTSLALLTPGQRSLVLPAPAVHPVAGMLIEITLEQSGGSPTGRPTGPVLFIGRLSQPGPDI